MGLAVDYQRVKVKCGITTTEYDAGINAIIAEQVPTLEFAIDPVFLNDTGNTGLMATLNLGATEIVCGEFLAERKREPGAMDTVRIGELSLAPMRVEGTKALDMMVLGWARLVPFLKKDIGVIGTIVAGAGGKWEQDS